MKLVNAEYEIDWNKIRNCLVQNTKFVNAKKKVVNKIWNYLMQNMKLVEIKYEIG
jgi:hypothetical protein